MGVINEGMLMEPGAVHARAKMSWQQVNLKRETVNAFMNHERLTTLNQDNRVRCFSTLPKGSGPAMVVGSGSSLNRILEVAPEWPFPVFCSSSHGPSFIYKGHPPEFLCLLDPQVARDEKGIVDEMGAPPGGWDKTALLTHPSAHPLYLERWFAQTQSPIYLFRLLEPTYDWYTHHLRWAYPWVTISLLPFIDSVASCLSLAVKLGHNPIYLSGVDYGGERFAGWNWDKDGWHNDRMMRPPDPYVPEQLPMKPGLHMGLGGLETSESMDYSQRGTLVVAFSSMKHEEKQTRIYLLSNHSNFTPFLPVLDWDNLKANHWEDGGPWPAEFRQKWCDSIEIYLAHQNTFMVPIHSGYSTADWRVYMMHAERARDAMLEVAREIMVNKENFEKIEKQFKMTVPEMIDKELLTLEKGEMLIRDPEERKTWRWEHMKPIDVEAMTRRIAWLMESEPPKPPDKLRA